MRSIRAYGPEHLHLVRERLLANAIVDLHGPRPVNDAPCWQWTGSIRPNGYGQVSAGTKNTTRLVHRAAYELWYGEIPAGAQVDHLCHPADGSCPSDTCSHRRCVNPAHLAAVTPRENTLRSAGPSALNAAKTHCDNGHEFTEANTYFDGKRRECRLCQRDKDRKRRGFQVPRTHCKSGRHPWVEENIYTDPGNGRSRCRPCLIERKRNRRRGIQGDAAA